MSFTYDFSDNVSISAADLNAIAEGIGENTLVSDNFDNNVSYAVNKLNCIRSDILNPGVINGCGCSVSDSTLILHTGTAVFENGMRLEITEPEAFPLSFGQAAFVYLYASESYNCALPIVCPAEKTSTAYIPIAKVDENRILTDLRQFSTAKIPLSSGSAVQTESVSYNVQLSGSAVSPNRSSHVINLKDKYFSYIIFDVVMSGKNSFGASKVRSIRGYFKRSTGLCYGYFGNTVYNGTDYIGDYNANSGTYIKPVFENGVLTIHTDCMDLTGTFTINLEVI